MDLERIIIIIITFVCCTNLTDCKLTLYKKDQISLHKIYVMFWSEFMIRKSEHRRRL